MAAANVQIPGVEVFLRQVGQDVTAGRSIARQAQGLFEQGDFLGPGLTGGRGPIEAGKAGCPALIFRVEFDGALEQVFDEGVGFVHLFRAVPHHQRSLVLVECRGGAAQEVRRRGGLQLTAGLRRFVALGDGVIEGAGPIEPVHLFDAQDGQRQQAFLSNSRAASWWGRPRSRRRPVFVRKAGRRVYRS